LKKVYAMWNIKINEAETIFEDFWEGHDTGTTLS